MITAIVCVCVCLTGFALLEDDGMLRSVAVFGSAAALDLDCECCFCCPLLSARCVCLVYTLVPFDWFFVCQQQLYLVYVFS